MARHKRSLALGSHASDVLDQSDLRIELMI